MSKRRILITGVKGFVGTHLAREIQANYADQFEILEFEDAQSKTRIDITDKAAIATLLTQSQPDVIVHLAAIASPREVGQDQEKAWSVNFSGTRNIATAIMAHAPNCHLIWSGSSESYGKSFNMHSTPIIEGAALEPLSSYGATKAACDVMLWQMMHDGLKATICRPFNHTGPGQSTTYVVPAFASQIAKIECGLQKPIVQVGNLEAYRDFLHVKDVIDAYICAALSPEKSVGGRYNISTGRPIQILEILNFLIDKTKMKIEVEVLEERYFANAVPTASGSFQALKADIDWSPQISAFDAFQEVLNEHRGILKS